MILTVGGVAPLAVEHHRRVLRRLPILWSVGGVGLARAVNPAMVRLGGANINRETVHNLEQAGFVMRKVIS